MAMDDGGELAEKLAALLGRLEGLRQALEDTRKTQAKKPDGFDRYCRAVTTEWKFVQSMCEGKKEVTKSRILSSNVSLYESLWVVIQREKGVIGIGQYFPLDGKPRALKIDVVCESGSKWVKVKAMNSKSIEDVYEGRGRYGEKSVAEMAADHLRCASQNKVNFGAPKVEFAFGDLKGIPVSILQQLQHAGVAITSADPDDAGPVVLPPSDDSGTGSPNRRTPSPDPDCEEDDEEGYGYILPPLPKGYAHAVDPATVKLVNLDITALIALCSELTHGGCQKKFPDHLVLQRQADDEVKRPVVASLQEFLEHKEFIVCERAVQEFEQILSIVGGPGEKAKGAELLARCRRVPDQPSATACNMEESRRIKSRQKVVFGTGDALQAITLTANINFVRAAQDQGVHFAVYTHPSRALTEMKGVWPSA